MDNRSRQWAYKTRMEVLVDKTLKDKDETIERLRFINGLMRKMLEFQRERLASIGIESTEFPDFVYEGGSRQMTATYTMKATCRNCKTTHITEILKGKSTFQHKTECPYCGENTNCDIIFSYSRPKES